MTRLLRRERRRDMAVDEQSFCSERTTRTPRYKRRVKRVYFAQTNTSRFRCTRRNCGCRANASPRADKNRSRRCRFDGMLWRFDTLHLTHQEHVREGADQRDDRDEREAAEERTRRRDDEADDDRRHDAGKVRAEIEDAARKADELRRRDVRDQRPAEIRHALTEERDRHHGDDEEIALRERG